MSPAVPGWNEGPMTAGDWVGAIFGLLLFGGATLFAIGWMLTFVWAIVSGMYYRIRYTNKGYCPECHQKMETVANGQSAGVYGGITYVLECPNGHSYEVGGRGQYDWAGF